MSEPKFVGLPVHGYKAQGQDAVAMVNLNKQAEESLLRMMDEYGGHPQVDKRWLAIARTNIEQGFMALNRSIFKPGRVALPEDEEGEKC
jgi:hypothetical protein